MKVRVYILCILVLTAGISWLFASPAGATSQDSHAGDVVLANKTVRMTLAGDGQIRELLRPGGANLLGRAAPWMSVRIGGAWHASNSLRSEGDLIRVGFEGSPAIARVRARPRADFIEVETIGIEGDRAVAVEQWAFACLPLKVMPRLGWWINICWDDTAAVGAFALDEKTDASGAPEPRVIANRRLGFAARKAAIIVCPTSRFPQVMRRIEKTYGIPSPTLGGEWAKRSREARKSWMITGLTMSDAPEPYRAERVFDVAKSLGVQYVVVSLIWWNVGFGHYHIQNLYFPKGVDSLKAAADMAHARGLKLGIHVMSRSITKDDAYVTPVPDQRLCKDGEVTLAQDVDAAAKDVPTIESPASFGTATGYWAYSGVDVQIDDEIIRYGGIHGEAPFALTGCERGAYGTHPADHKAGAKVRHITERYGWYVANADLSAEIGRNVADIVNKAGLDMVCFDGADVAADPEVSYYEGHQVLQSVGRNVRRDVLLASNGTTHFGWHTVARGGEEDAMARGFQGWVDDRTVHGWGLYHVWNLLTPDFSWVGIYPHTPIMTAARPDDIELVCARSLGYDGVIGWGFAACYGGPSTVETFARNGRRDEISNLISTYEKLRLDGYFASGVRKPLQAQGAHWHLLPPDATHRRYRVAQAGYLKSGIVRSGADTSGWTLDNRLGPQPLRVRIEALSALAPYGSPESIVVADFDKLTFTPGGLAGARVSVRRADDRHPQAGGVLRLTCPGPTPEDHLPARLIGHGQPAWAQASASFPSPIDLKGHRALGLWVKGDGGGEVLNVQTEVEPLSYLHYYVPITFTGWRYCEVGEPEGDRVMDYFMLDKAAMHDLPLDSFRSMKLMILNPPAGKPVDLSIGRIEALAEHPVALDHPRVTVGGVTLDLAVTLQPEQYLETGDLWGARNPSTVRVFDPDGKELKRFDLPSPPPQIPPGKSDARLSSQGDPGARAKVTVMLMKEP